MKLPVNVADPNNILGILINKLFKEEDITRQRSLLDSDIFTELLRKSNVSWSRDFKHSTLFDVVAIGHYIGPCVSKYGQTSDKNVDYHVYPSGKQVTKVFIASNFTFMTIKVKLLQTYLMRHSILWRESASPGIFRRITRTTRRSPYCAIRPTRQFALS
jgi:hypothetical protein